METGTIEKSLSSRFESVVPCKDNIYRAARKHKGKEYQVHYVDFSGAISEEGFEVEEYQRNLLLGDYYAQEDSLKKNFYLHFIVSGGNENLAKKSQIEGNKILARKDVQTLEGFLGSLDPIKKSEAGEADDIISIWKELIEGDLPSLFDRDEAVTSVVEKFIEEVDEYTEFLENSNIQASPFLKIKSMHLDEYRMHPKKRDHHFGKVNLIMGPNAVGKTSLLEAIELAICGKTVRSEDDDQEEENFKFRIVDESGSEIVSKKESNKFYRDRDRSWYGKIYHQNNQLHKSFSQFNYFDSDAAARFSERVKGGSSISKALSQIVLGEAAEAQFKRIKRCQELLIPERTKYRKEISDIEFSLKSYEEELADREMARQEGATLELVLKKIKLLGAVISPANEDGIRKYSETFTDKSLNLSVWSSAVVRFNVKEYGSFSKIQEKFQKEIDALEESNSKRIEKRKEGEVVDAKLRIRKDSAKLLERLNDYFSSGAFEISNMAKEISKLTKEYNAFSLAVSGYDDLSNERLSAYFDQNVTTATSHIQKTIDNKKAKLLAKKRAVEESRENLDKINYLIQEIRSKGIELVSLNPATKQCPLCVTDFEDQTLIQRIPVNTNLLQEDPSSLEQLFADISKLEKEIEARIKEHRSLEALNSAYKNLPSAPKELSVGEVIRELESARSKANEINSSIFDLKTRYSAMEVSGFTQHELTELVSKYEDTNPTRKIVDAIAVRGDLAKEITVLEKSAFGLVSDVSALDAAIERGKRQFPALNDYDFQSREYFLSEFNQLQLSIDELAEYLTITDDDSLNTVQGNVQTIRELISSYLSSLEDKKWAKQVLEKIGNLKTSIEMPRKILERIETTLDKVSFVIDEHYPELYTKKFMVAHMKTISEIFGRIHSPKEFSDVEYIDEDIMVVREADGERYPISKLSTGQRTALVLSVFLALNSTLETAPKILIFDDPVAYVDDLNILSFIDFLVNQILDGDRQIFFVTASDKIAKHFSSKFDFMTEGESGFTTTRLTR